MSAAHTPGPWERGDSHKTSINAGPKHIAMVNWYKSGGDDDVSGSEHEANVALIAAAPELLAALRAFPGFTDDARIGDVWIGQMERAIEAATGKPAVVVSKRMPQPKMVDRKCKWCKGPFKARAADVARGWGQFCSKSCKANKQEKRTGQYAALQNEERMSDQEINEQMHQQALQDSTSCHGQDPGEGF